MEVIGTAPTGEGIIKTLIELLEAQEQIKITYEINRKEEAKYGNIKNRFNY